MYICEPFSIRVIWTGAEYLISVPLPRFFPRVIFKLFNRNLKNRYESALEFLAYSWKLTIRVLKSTKISLAKLPSPISANLTAEVSWCVASGRFWHLSSPADSSRRCQGSLAPEVTSVWFTA